MSLAERTALVVSVSNRASAGVYEDTTGPRIVVHLEELGLTDVRATVVPDGEPVRDALEAAVSDGVDLVVTTGGTGLTPTDQTPEMTRSVLDREVPGIAEAIRAYGVANGIPAASLSRGLVGLAGSTLIVNLPGSPGGVKDGLAVLTPILEHALEQVHGSDHARGGGPETPLEGPGELPGGARPGQQPGGEGSGGQPGGEHSGGPGGAP